MKIVYTDEALRDLDEILSFIKSNYPTVFVPFVRRLRIIERRIARWPQSAQRVEQEPGIRMVPFIRYPYKIFYRVTTNAVEILHIHRAARKDP
jgi:toxin ParE1/3/4